MLMLLAILLLPGCFLVGKGDKAASSPVMGEIVEEEGPMMELNDHFFLKRVKNQKWKLVNENGVVLRGMMDHPGYDQILPFDRGFAPVQLNEKWKLVDQEGVILPGMNDNAGADVLFRCREISWLVRATWCAKMGDSLGSVDKKGHFNPSYALQPNALKADVKKVVSKYGKVTLITVAIVGLVAVGGYGVAKYVTFLNNRFARTAASAAANALVARNAAAAANAAVDANAARNVAFAANQAQQNANAIRHAGVAANRSAENALAAREAAELAHLAARDANSARNAVDQPAAPAPGMVRRAANALHENFFRLYNFVISPRVADDFSCLICQQDHHEGVVESPACGVHQQNHQAHLSCLSEWFAQNPRNARCLMCYQDFRRAQ